MPGGAEPRAGRFDRMGSARTNPLRSRIAIAFALKKRAPFAKAGRVADGFVVFYKCGE